MDKKRIKLEEELYALFVFQDTLEDDLADKYERKFNRLSEKYVKFMTKIHKVDDAYIFLESLDNKLEALQDKADKN